jgi:hypothetical protein
MDNNNDYTKIIKNNKQPCRFGHACIKSHCNENKSHPDNWDICNICNIQSIYYNNKSKYAIDNNDIIKSMKFLRKSLIYAILSIIKKNPDGIDISYQQVYKELFGLSIDNIVNESRILFIIETVIQAIDNAGIYIIAEVMIQTINETKNQHINNV